VNTVKEKAEALAVACTETGAEANADKTKYMVMSRDHDVGRSHSIKNYNSYFENVEEFKYLGTTLKNQISIQEEIKSRSKLGNVCYYSVRNLLSSSLLSKNLKIKIHRTIILLVISYGCATWSLTLREESRMRVFENRVLKRIFGCKRDEVTGEWSRLHNEGLNDMYCTSNIIRVIKSRKVALSFRFRYHNNISIFLLFIGTK